MKNVHEESIRKVNDKALAAHRRRFDFVASELSAQGVDVEKLITRLDKIEVATPSWALGTGGTRFGRFPGGGEPRDLGEKLDDIRLLAELSKRTASVSLHIPWDLPENPAALKAEAAARGLAIDSVNSNTFQDQPGQAASYKFGSLSNPSEAVRAQAIEHNVKCVELGRALGSETLVIWLPDGSSYPGQSDFERSFRRTAESLKKIHGALKGSERMIVEHKPFEPAFYSSVNADWGSSLLLARSAGPRATCLVDLGHHLPNANIEQVVSRFRMEGLLGGFHFNDSKYADDDLTAGCLKPYQLFLIFLELLPAFQGGKAPSLMIDASHNLKDPLEDLLQSLQSLSVAAVQAMLVDPAKLVACQDACDPSGAEELLKNAFHTDVRPVLAEARLRKGGAIDPVACYRALGAREERIRSRGKDAKAKGF